MSSDDRINVFCSYSDEERSDLERLEKHLKSLERMGSVLVWHKHKITAGQEHRREIDNQIKAAHIILLLISSNFISSDDCYAGELVNALNRHHDENIPVIPARLIERTKPFSSKSFLVCAAPYCLPWSE